MTQSEFLKSIRQYFWAKNFTEVEISYLNKSLPLEPNIYSFKTNWVHKNQDFYLPTSPEFALKEFLAKHNQDCFAISHCFRDLEDSNSTHTPEFLMLEWYEVDKNLDDLMNSTKQFISSFLNLKFEILNLPIDLPQNEPDFNQYFLNNIENNLPKDKAVFITGYPAFLSPLAAVGTDPCVCSLRFELYINGLEIGNGCVENTDPISIKKSFDQELLYRQKNNLPSHPPSTEFIENSSKLSLCSGIGVGIERLLTIINKNEQIRPV